MPMIVYGQISLFSFLLGVGILCIPILGLLNSGLELFLTVYWKYYLIGYALVTNVIFLILYQGRPGESYQVSIRGGLLGLVFGVAVILSLSQSSFRLFGWYLGSLAFFHWSEYITTAATNPTTLSLNSYLLDHSKEYHLAAVASFIEFTIEWWLFPGMKLPSWLSVLGLLVVIAGEILRKDSMITASTNFNHYVQHNKQEGHRLVKHGVYRLFRHPAYVGWFYWSIATQVMLCNPLCLVAYTYAAWKFFNHRIMEEEISLLNFFGEEYLEYQKNVGTGIPFIKGYRMEL